MQANLIYLITHEYLIAVVVVASTCYLIYKHKTIEALEIFSSSIMVAGLGVLMKMLWKVPRPDDALVKLNSYAYPSIHSAWIATITLIIYLIWIRRLTKKRWVVIADVSLGMLVLAIGASRVYLGVHTPEDVIGGYSLGVIVALIVFVSFKLKDLVRKD